MAKNIYFDNAATMTKIKTAIKAEADFYQKIDANALRGLYEKSVLATKLLEKCRKKVAEYIAADNTNIIFTRGATESLNMVADGLKIDEDALVLIDINNHHSNILPWTERYKNTKISQNILEDNALSEAKVVVMNGMSNVTGQIFADEILKVREKIGEDTIIVVDAAQMIAHYDVSKIINAVDYLAFSGHKIGAPMGIGVLYVRDLSKLEPTIYGGEMVDVVKLNNNKISPVFADGVQKFEGGTLNLGGIAGLLEAINFWSETDRKSVFAKINKMAKILCDSLVKIPEVEFCSGRNGIVIFNIRGVHPHDTAQILSYLGFDVRAGYHCAQPFLEQLGHGPVVRVSLSMFNTDEEILKFVDAIKKVRGEIGL